MISLFAWGLPFPRWLAGLILLGLLAAAIFLSTGSDPATLDDVGSWRWPHEAHLG